MSFIGLLVGIRYRILEANAWLLKQAPAAYMLLAFFSLWTTILFILWFFGQLGVKHVGFASGRPFEMMPIKDLPASKYHGTTTKSIRGLLQYRCNRYRVMFLVCGLLYVVLAYALVSKGIYMIHFAVNTLHDLTSSLLNSAVPKLKSLINSADEIKVNATFVANGIENFRLQQMLCPSDNSWESKLSNITRTGLRNTREVADFFVTMPTSDFLTAIMQAQSNTEEALSWSPRIELALANASYRLLSALVSVPLMLMISVCLAFSKSRKFLFTPMTSCLATWILVPVFFFLVWILIVASAGSVEAALKTSPSSCLFPVSTDIDSSSTAMALLPLKLEQTTLCAELETEFSKLGPALIGVETKIHEVSPIEPCCFSKLFPTN